MIRGRLDRRSTARPIVPDDFRRAERAHRLVDREFNLSHSATLPRAQHRSSPAAGHDNEAGGVQRRGTAWPQTLGLKLGDALRFDVWQASTIEGRKVTSIRKVDWSSMRVNFFVLFPTSKASPDAPVSYIAAYRAPDDAGLRQRVSRRDFPNITSIDVSASIAQVQRVLDQVVQRGRVPVRLHARRRPRRPLRGGERDARGACARVRRDARARRERQAAGAGAARRAARRRRARGPARIARRDRGELGAGALRVRVQLEPVTVGAARRRRRRRRCSRSPPAGGDLREVLTRPVVQTLRQAADV